MLPLFLALPLRIIAPAVAPAIVLLTLVYALSLRMGLCGSLTLVITARLDLCAAATDLAVLHVGVPGLAGSALCLTLLLVTLALPGLAILLCA